jgi:hypothetical protein
MFFIFFWAKFSQPGDQKKLGWRIQQRGFLRLLKTNSPYLDPKNKLKKSPDLDSVFLWVARTRQDSKKDLLLHHDSRHLLSINAEDHSQCTYLRNLKIKIKIK